ncbi:hypothetical protein EFA69_06510 [Rufibacter immobilis]|uniref:Uncharacterized protein n=2 Tax=Rufibacter immobilis TaxID=1348778 RepID=A0A3M9MZG1_9BACT|nr:hypothetical protein EFA69_06510 [Rufibacter immobilis]
MKNKLIIYPKLTSFQVNLFNNTLFIIKEYMTPEEKELRASVVENLKKNKSPTLLDLIAEALVQTQRIKENNRKMIAVLDNAINNVDTEEENKEIK